MEKIDCPCGCFRALTSEIPGSVAQFRKHIKEKKLDLVAFIHRFWLETVEAPNV